MEVLRAMNGSTKTIYSWFINFQKPCVTTLAKINYRELLRQ